MREEDSVSEEGESGTSEGHMTSFERQAMACLEGQLISSISSSDDLDSLSPPTSFED
eukprot:CAMPEP_0185623978 /NCGR_PEP_ID=MMETSP0436-20130131/60265_1 /TAXON_ID=626734 ORGANISM="Favella taraikaensis, Strain Fe Narragansett Bay" /NCGR_SAMPLE_ID=MMETSP0436 /ASSEMBLY_ACC=CAM_ASM_000390 /LENGTH=56 /DNA_ID=CAMNT_0028266257 /DNA_START=297 /DNA_END=467 /DNA_ORIENTATION=+